MGNYLDKEKTKLADQYRELSDDELISLWYSDLTDETVLVLKEELAKRDIYLDSLPGDDILAQLQLDLVKKDGKENLKYGVMWVIGGIALYVSAYLWADLYIYYVSAWGAIVYGVILINRGWLQIRSDY